MRSKLNYKKCSAFLLLGICILSCSSEPKPIDPRVSKITGTTLNGKKIDSTYFTGKVTFVNFLFIGCPGCMMELTMLNDLNKEYGKRGFQILSIAANAPSQLKMFNSDDSSEYAGIRRYYNIDLLSHDLIAECSEDNLKPQPPGEDLVLSALCDNISKYFLKDSTYPHSFLLSKNGRIVKDFLGVGIDTVTGKPESADIRHAVDSLLSAKD